MNKNTFILSYLLFVFTSTFAQKPTVIVFRYNLDSLKKDSIYLSLNKPLGLRTFGEDFRYPEKIISVKKKRGFIETTCQYSISDVSCAYIATGFGYKTFVIPGDNIVLDIMTKPKPTVKFKGKYARPWFNDLLIQGKNKFIYALFDSLANRYGALGWSSGLPFKKSDSIADFCKSASENYADRIEYLIEYAKKYGIPATYVKLAKAEIYADYVTDLIKPLIRGIAFENYPSQIKTLLLNTDFNDPYLYFRTSDYSTTAYSYAMIRSRLESKLEPYSDADLVSGYDYIKASFTDTIRNHLLAQHLSTFLGNPNLIYPSFDSLLIDYKSICRNKLYMHFIDSAYEFKKKQIIKKHSLTDAMSSVLIDTTGRSIPVKNVFASKPVIIICWASWCVPCIKEMPAEQKLQDRFKGKIDFIYVSFDKSKSAWQTKYKSLDIQGNNYLLKDYFRSDFAGFYKISSLPYYLLYDKNGQLVPVGDARPSDKDFGKILEKIVSTK